MATRVLDPVECSAQPLDIAFHPSKEILAAGLVDGTVEFHDYSLNMNSNVARKENADEDDTILSSIEVHVSESPKIKLKTPLRVNPISSCRATVFSFLGDMLYTGSSGGSISAIDVTKASNHHTSDGSLLWKIDNASPFGINAIFYMKPSNPKVGDCLVTGDDEGVIRIWDLRICGTVMNYEKRAEDAFKNCIGLPKGCIASFHENSDFISSFQVDSSGDTLLAASADGTLTVIDLRNDCKEGQKVIKRGVEPVKLHQKTEQGPFRLHRRSDDQEDELLSMCIMKGGRKVVCGTQDGILNFWSWNTWGDISDRFPGHPKSIDALLKVDEDTLLTGSNDGIVRVLQLQPDKLLGVLGDHNGFPVEKLRFGANNRVIGSVSYDTMIRMWDASIFNDDGDNDAIEDTETSAVADDRDALMANGGESEDDWEDVDSDDSMDDSDSDDNEKGRKRSQKLKTENELFFEDL